MKILLVIPARKGSSFYRKNLKLLNSTPLIRYTLEASKIEIPHDTLVTTDDSYIMDECVNYDVKIDQRPENLADDKTTLDQVMYYIATNYPYDIYILLPPTSPFRTKIHIEEALKKFLDNKADSLISVTEELKSIWSLDADNFIRPLIERTKNRQQENPCYISNGAIFISRRELILKYHKKASGHTMLYVMDKESSIDIHNEQDIKLAEYWIKF